MVHVLAAGVVTACIFLVVVLFHFISVCLPADAPDDSSPGFPTEAVGYFHFSLSTDVAALAGFFLFFLSSSHSIVSHDLNISLSFPLLTFFPCPLSRSALICITHINK